MQSQMLEPSPVKNSKIMTFAETTFSSPARKTDSALRVSELGSSKDLGKIRMNTGFISTSNK